jgi:hypothetical protein
MRIREIVSWFAKVMTQIKTIFLHCHGRFFVFSGWGRIF